MDTDKRIYISFGLEPSLTLINPDTDDEDVVRVTAGTDLSESRAPAALVIGIGDDHAAITMSATEDGRVDPLTFLRSLRHCMGVLAALQLRAQARAHRVLDTLSEEDIQAAIEAAAGNKNAN